LTEREDRRELDIFLRRRWRGTPRAEVGGVHHFQLGVLCTAWRYCMVKAGEEIVQIERDQGCSKWKIEARSLSVVEAAAQWAE